MLDKLDQALNATGYPLKIYGWSEGPKTVTWGVYAPEMGGDLLANNRHIETASYCRVHLYTRDSSGTPRAKIEAVLNDLACAWRLSNVQYENDTGYIHYAWRCGLRGAL